MSQSYTQCRHCLKLFLRNERHLHPCYENEVRNSSHYVIPDIQPYQAMGIDERTGKVPVITSRREHREYLRANNYIEVGNEMPSQRKYEGDHNVRAELSQATREVMAKYR